jgi:hypothetical protein
VVVKHRKLFWEFEQPAHLRLSRLCTKTPSRRLETFEESGFPALAKAGWTRHEENIPVPLLAADGAVR